jgi:LCP family protein required for cell wall assembly
MPLVDTADFDILNFLLLGSDTANPQNSGRTDVIMVISVNRTHGTAALLSIPRDLYVYVPDVGMRRINTAYAQGEQIEPGTGSTLLVETIRYNLGLRIDRYARIDFNDFRQIIDAVGGVDVSVDCAIEDWRLIDPTLDPNLEENWAKFTLPIGVHHMDGDLALWYARSRRTSSDFDRGQRQQEIMRALWRHLRMLGLLYQLPDVWPQLIEVVDTDISLPDMMGLLPFALALEPNRVTSYTFHLDKEVVSWRAPDGAQVLLPQREALSSLVNNYLMPPTRFQLEVNPPTVRIVNASSNPDLAVVAAERLSWEGFRVEIAADRAGQYWRSVTIYDYTGQRKGGDLDSLKSILRVSDDGVIITPDASRQHDYEVILGSSYYTCTRDVLPPVEELAGL